MTAQRGARIDGGLEFQRLLAHPLDVVWTFLTDPDQCSAWFGTWEGSAAPGETVPFTMTAEDPPHRTDLTVHVCDPHRLLAVEVGDDAPRWRLTVELSADGGCTSLTFRHLLAEYDSAYGPGWEYYLDRLDAALAGAAMPDWDDYVPAGLAYYDAL